MLQVHDVKQIPMLARIMQFKHPRPACKPCYKHCLTNHTGHNMMQLRAKMLAKSPCYKHCLTNHTGCNITQLRTHLLLARSPC
jgi:hypothetical protein